MRFRKRGVSVFNFKRWQNRLIQFPKYLYWHGIDLINIKYSLEMPKLLEYSSSVMNETKDRTDSLEFYMYQENNPNSDFLQKNTIREEKVSNIKNKFKTTKCFICDSELTPITQIINFNDVNDYIETSWCQTCGHTQYSVMPTKEWITEWYSLEYDTSVTLNKKLESRRKTYRYYNRLKKFLPNKKLKILEIGAGYGEKIAPFKDDGHEIYCTEITSDRARYLKETMHYHVFQGTLDDPAVRASIIENGPYDLIFSYHVIEHMYNPKEELQILKEVAAKDAIFYLAIPEFYKEGIINNIFNLEHLHSFSRTSGKRLMNEVGFDVIKDGNDYFQYYSDYCQYFIGQRSEKVHRGTNVQDKKKLTDYLFSSLKLEEIHQLKENSFAYKYNTRPPMNLYVTDESKEKCAEPEKHLPIKYYHKSLPLFIMN